MTQLHGDDEDGLPELSNRKMLGILMQEIADVRKELKEDIYNLGGRMNRLESEMHTLHSEMHTLRLEVHHNQATFIHNHENHEKRMKVLEIAAA